MTPARESIYNVGGSTPGPWFIAEQYGRPHYPSCIIEAQWAEGEDHVVAEAYGEANARLIAAAPQLLEVCLSAAPFLLGNPVAAGVRQRLGDAIGKVYGES